MSRCICCNKVLTKNELTRKYVSGEFTDTCGICWDLTGRSEGVEYTKGCNTPSYYKIPDEELKFGYAFGMDELGANPEVTIAEKGVLEVDLNYLE